MPDVVSLQPDTAFIREVMAGGGADLKKCYQCAACSVVCALAPAEAPFPRRQMLLAQWGLKDLLMVDPAIWLCHQCNDCSANCPRGARPGDVLAAVRQQAVRHYSAPRVLGRWLGQPQSIPLALGVPAALLTAALIARDPLAGALGLLPQTAGRIVYSYSRLFPQWLLNGLFGSVALLAVLVLVTGALRYWRAMQAAFPADRDGKPAVGLAPAIRSTLVRLTTHRDFTSCTKGRPRLTAHVCALFGYLALALVSLWVVTASVNPLIRGDFVYPFGFWSPWKLLANLGGAALLTGCLLMARDRLLETTSGSTSYADWVLIASLLLATVTGFFTETLHYLRLEPHRHVAYFVHLVFAFTVLAYLPYTNFAHLAYRGAAVFFAERVGLGRETSSTPAAPRLIAGREG